MQNVIMSPAAVASSGVSTLITVSSQPTTVSSITTTSTLYSLGMVLEEDKPVQVIDDTIEINEELLREDVIIPLNYKGEQFYVRKVNGAPEIFQITD